MIELATGMYPHLYMTDEQWEDSLLQPSGYTYIKRELAAMNYPGVNHHSMYCDFCQCVLRDCVCDAVEATLDLLPPEHSEGPMSDADTGTVLPTLNGATRDNLRIALNDAARLIAMKMTAQGFWDDIAKIHAVIDHAVRTGFMTQESGNDLKFQANVMKRLSKVALDMSELGEQVEAIRKSKMGRPLMSNHISSFQGDDEEMADSIIRKLDYAGHFGVPIGDAVIAKMDYNDSRPFKHGKSA
jgi:hypothetical protein